MTGKTRINQSAVPGERLATLSLSQQVLIALYVIVSVWYLSWRPNSFNPEAPLFSLLIYGAEVFGFVCALLFFYMCWRLKRRSPLPPLPEATVAIFIPTINESVDLVRRTALAAQRVKRATEVWLLDDGNREEMRELARQLGCRYLARTENSHAKAGNLNNALRHTDAEFIAIFDADHAPAPSFLEETLGFFADERVAFVQTPQDFYNLDSFQHRIDHRDSLVWSEQTLFFRVIQAGKDRLNSAFFCGSCAIIRRKALDDIGGFATGTVTEDIHTSLKLHKRGWRSVYYGKSLAFGLAPSTAIPFLKQRLRWGQGAMQMWRQEGILLAPGLTLSQRLSYIATILAYFEGWQRAVLFLGPVIVLTTGVMPILAVDQEFLIRFIPYIILNFWAFEEVARGYGRSLLTEQYNMMRFAVFITATFGFFLRKLRFVVTPKNMGQTDATRRTLWPQYVVFAMNAAAIPIGLLMHWASGRLTTGALIANILWASLTLGIAALAIRYALRVARFQRREYRFPLPVPFRAETVEGPAVGLATDISPLGCRLTGPFVGMANVGESIRGELMLPAGSVPVEVVVRSRFGGEGGVITVAKAVGSEFRWATADDRSQLEMFLFGSDLQWRLNGFEERIRTPLERVDDLLSGARDIPGTLSGQQWTPLLYRTGRDKEFGGVGFISGAREGARTVVAIDSLPHLVLAQEVTPLGPRGVVGRVMSEELVDTHAAPLHLYRVTA